MTDRHTADTINDDALDQLYDDVARYEEVVGELNQANTELARKAGRAEATLARVRAEADAIERGVLGDHDVAFVCRVAAQRIRAALDEPPGPAAIAGQPITEEQAAAVRAANLPPGTRVTRTVVEEAMGKSGPAATQATEAIRQMDADTTEPHTGLVVQPYTVHGERKWVFRCWGTDTCDGWLSLDHYNEQSATRARDRHAAEEHLNEEQH